ncbi:MAG TPA: hypothetical protein VF290_20205 [Pyrinomonadaceae bacterium]
MMILRRTMLLGLAFLGLSPACTKTSSNSLSQASATDVSGSLPPHCEALSLVWKTQAEQIKLLELKHVSAGQQKESVGIDGWWFDTDERRWTVTRPFAPGVMDSTHWFTVTYLVGATESLSWQVDTRKSEVSLIQK